MKTLSEEELANLKQLHKAQDLSKIIKQEEDKKNKEKPNFVDAQGDENKEDEDDDQNFISNSDIVNKLNFGNAQEKRESVYKRLKDELDNVVAKLRSAIRPINNEIRSLNEEIGGVEVNYQAIKKGADNDVDVWDNRTKKLAQAAVEASNQDAEENLSFIHGVKAGLFGRRGKRRRSMGQVDMSKVARGDDDAKPVGFADKIKQLREDKTTVKGGGGMEL